MTRFKFDSRTGQMGIMKEPKLTNDQIVKRVKHVHRNLIVVNKITDEELVYLVNKIMTGTRNLAYLTTTDNRRRLQAVATYIIREFSY